MSYDIPAHIKPEIRDYAQSEHISPDEAIERLLVSGLIASRSATKPGKGRRIAGDALELVRQARASRTIPEPITATEFFAEIKTTKGFKSKAEGRRHIQDLRNEWQ